MFLYIWKYQYYYYNIYNPLEQKYCKQSDNLSNWNLYWTEVMNVQDGITVYNPESGEYWTKYIELYLEWFNNCTTDKSCICKEYKFT